MNKRFFKENFTEEEALEEYYRIESQHHLSQHSGLQSEILERNISNVNKPNLLWHLKGQNESIVWFTTSRNRHLIVVSWQDKGPPFVGKSKVVEILKSIRFMSQKDAEKILQSFANGN